jgi:hypothetical protein
MAACHSTGRTLSSGLKHQEPLIIILDGVS